MVKYGYVCKYCGYHSLSDDKEDTKEAKKWHRLLKKNIVNPGCQLTHVGKNHFRRTDLVGVQK